MDAIPPLPEGRGFPRKLVENNIPRYRGFLTQKEHGEDISSPTVERFALVKDQDLGRGG